MSQDDFALAEPGSGLSFTYDGLKVISVAPISVGTNGVTLTLGAANQTLAVNSAGNAWEYKTYTSPLTVGATTVSIAGLSTLGTANQMVGMNAAASGWEYKTATVTSAGAIAGATTITASGRISGGSGQFGGATNYAAWSTSGVLTLNGTARVNRVIVLGIDGLATGVSAPTAVRLGNYYGYGFGTAGLGWDDGFVRPFEMPYEWVGSGNIQVKLHWYVNEALGTTQAVRWNILWTATTEGTGVLDAATTTLDFGNVTIPAVAKTLVETTAIIATGIAPDQVVGMQVTRATPTGGVLSPTADAVLIGLEIEYISDKLGEPT